MESGKDKWKKKYRSVFQNQSCILVAGQTNVSSEHIPSFVKNLERADPGVSCAQVK